jgi:hypothetical protein
LDYDSDKYCISVFFIDVVLDVGDVNDDVSDMERRRKGHDESRGRFDT